MSIKGRKAKGRKLFDLSLVKATRNGKIVASDGSIFPVDRRDHEAFAMGCQLHDTTVDALFAIIEADADWSFAPSYCVQALFGTGARTPSLKKADIDIKDICIKYFEDVFTKNSWILFPICDCNHFYLAEIKERTFCLYDSLRTYSKKDAQYFLNRLIERAIVLKGYSDNPTLNEITKGEWTIDNIETAQQNNNTDCGVYITKYAIDLKNMTNEYVNAFDAAAMRNKLKEMFLANVNNRCDTAKNCNGFERLKNLK